MEIARYQGCFEAEKVLHLLRDPTKGLRDAFEDKSEDRKLELLEVAVLAPHREQDVKKMIRGTDGEKLAKALNTKFARAMKLSQMIRFAETARGSIDIAWSKQALEKSEEGMFSVGA